jgi:hypothetical protein
MTLPSCVGRKRVEDARKRADDPRIHRKKYFVKAMDCRVKPGNDGDSKAEPHPSRRSPAGRQRAFGCGQADGAAGKDAEVAEACWQAIDPYTNKPETMIFNYCCFAIAPTTASWSRIQEASDEPACQ